MSRLSAQDLLNRSFRAGTGYRLVVFNRLAVEEQLALGELARDPDFYGVLLPEAGSGRTLRAMNKETALLWLTLREPGPLPFFVWTGDAEESSSGLSELVLDGVLEIESEGRYVCGGEALALFAIDGDARDTSRLAELSRRALLHAQELGTSDPQELTAHLYGFNRRPATPEWTRRLPDAEAVLAFLGVAAGSAERRRLEAAWRVQAQSEERGWITLSRGQIATAGSAAYKLYVSPAAESLPAAFSAVASCLEKRPAACFKVGNDAAGVLRPDKLVAYFDTVDALHAAARELEAALSGMPAQGVPFSAPIDRDGLLSWGMDPPRAERKAAPGGQESWRLWVARRLASALLAAGGTGAEPWRFALERLRCEGVDVDRWTPSAALWRAA